MKVVPRTSVLLQDGGFLLPAIPGDGRYRGGTVYGDQAGDRERSRDRLAAESRGAATPRGGAAAPLQAASGRGFPPDAFADLVANEDIQILIGWVGATPVGYVYAEFVRRPENAFR